jgi:hypothetical protein
VEPLDVLPVDVEVVELVAVEVDLLVEDVLDVAADQLAAVEQQPVLRALGAGNERRRSPRLRRLRALGRSGGCLRLRARNARRPRAQREREQRNAYDCTRDVAQRRFAFSQARTRRLASSKIRS